MKRHLVCLTFDFDAMSGFIARGMTSATPVSRGEFGADVAAPRILELLKKYRIPSSWYIPGHTLETYPDRCQQVARGWPRNRPPWLDPRAAGPANPPGRRRWARTRQRADQKAHRRRYARGYRSPAWDLSPHSVELLLKHGSSTTAV